MPQFCSRGPRTVFYMRGQYSLLARKDPGPFKPVLLLKRTSSCTKCYQSGGRIIKKAPGMDGGVARGAAYIVMFLCFPIEWFKVC